MHSENYDIVKTPPKALLFDVFGTVVNWRASLTANLVTAATLKLQSKEVNPEMRAYVETFDKETWGRFAQDWRDDYLQYAQDFKPETEKFQRVDQHWWLSLQELVKRYRLEGFYTEDDMKKLVASWHSLEPWPDTSVGMQMLGSQIITCTLSDGHHAVLRDLDAFGKLHFQQFLSSEDFGAYKPHPSVYLGAAKRLGLEPHECCMVAAHLRDLDGARKCGYRTMFVDRPQEEQWPPEDERYQEAKSGWVDMWISVDEPGFIAAAERFGIPKPA